MATSQRENPCLRCPETFKFSQSIPCLSVLSLFDLLIGVEKTFCTVKPIMVMTFYKNLCPGVMKFTILVVIITIPLGHTDRHQNFRSRVLSILATFIVRWQLSEIMQTYYNEIIFILVRSVSLADPFQIPQNCLC